MCLPTLLISTIIPKHTETTTFKKKTKQMFQTDSNSQGEHFLFFINLFIETTKQISMYRYKKTCHLVPGPTKALRDEKMIEQIEKKSSLNSFLIISSSQADKQDKIDTTMFNV